MAAIDVIIPAYNAAATLREAIDSIREQTFSDIRIVVVDDGSTDATPQILAGLAHEDSRVHIVTRTNGGIVEARNDGLRACTAEFIACLDADDIAFPGRFQRQIDYLRTHPDCVAVGGEVEHMDEKGRPLPGLTQPGDPMKSDPVRAPALEPYIIQSTLMARREEVAAVGGYRDLPVSEDSDLLWRLQERGRLAILPEKLGRYRVHAGSTSSSLVNGRIMAVVSQLVALSARRRRAGKADIAFPRELHEAMKKAVTLEAMWALAAERLSFEEAQHLKLASAAKLMELAGYRPFEPDAADCAFIRAALPAAKRLAPKNRGEVEWHVTSTAARLVRRGKMREAFTLTPPKSYPVATARLLLAR